MNTTANTNTTTRTAKAVNNLVWLVDYSSELVNETRDGRRDSDGRFLKQHCKLGTTAKRHGGAGATLAARFGVDADELFAA